MSTLSHHCTNDSQHSGYSHVNGTKASQRSCDSNGGVDLLPSVTFRESSADEQSRDEEEKTPSDEAGINSTPSPKFNESQKHFPPLIRQYTCSLKQPEWVMPPPGSVPNCPPGLEYLTQVDQILVHQVVELLEAFTGWETKNRYVLKNTLGQQVYYAMEESDLCMRQCCGPARAFVIHITDNMEQEVMLIRRQFKCCAGCCWFAACSRCTYEVCIEAPPGQVIAYVTQQCSPWPPRFVIHSASEASIVQCNTEGLLLTAADNNNDTNNHDTNSPSPAITSPPSSLVQMGGSTQSISSLTYTNSHYCRAREELFIKGPICVCQGAWCCEQDFMV
ncbi:phospholipid scramblase 2-like isoform X2 [Symsagittifera roscoffensis]